MENLATATVDEEEDKILECPFKRMKMDIGSDSLGVTVTSLETQPSVVQDLNSNGGDDSEKLQNLEDFADDGGEEVEGEVEGEADGESDNGEFCGD